MRACLLYAVLSGTFFTVVNGVTAPSSGRIDFKRDVQPIFETRCYECHGPLRRRAGLRLDDKESVVNGGESGARLLGGDTASNELYLRVISQDEDYVMPRKRERLSPGQAETIRRWVEQGTPWPDDAGRTGGATGEKIYERFIRPYRYGLVIVLILAVIVERARFLGRRSRSSTQARSRRWIEFCGRTPWSVYPAGLLAFALIALFNDYQALREKQRQFAFEIREAVYMRVFGSPPSPIRHEGPKRLGGTFYRGNDERDERLFNGGNYRTCNFHLALCAADETKLNYGDSVPEDGLYVRLEIERAPGATPELYAPRIMNRIFFSEEDYNRMDAVFDEEPVRLRTIQEGERWRAMYPLGRPSFGKRSGLIYLYVAKPVRGAPFLRRPVYGIRLDLRFENGRIGEASDLWIGNLVLNDALQLPKGNNRVPMDQWFSAEPIPEITGTNTADPELLGVRDYENPKE